MKNNTISIVVPVFNEEDAVLETVDAIDKLFSKSRKQYEIVVVDDGSTDDSAKKLKELKNIVFIRHPQNRGYGASLKTGISKAKGKIIIITDADGTYENKRMLELADLADSYEMVVAARTTFEGGYPLLKKIAKMILHGLIHFLTRTKVPDINSGLRAFHKETVMKHFHLLPDRFSFTTTITIAYISENRSIHFIDSTYFTRKGESKITPLDFFRFFFKIINTVNYFMPMRIFFPVGFVIGAVATVSLGVDIFYLANITDKTILLGISTILIFLMGFLADLVVKRTTPNQS